MNSESETVQLNHCEPTTVFCPRCGKPMLIAPEHARIPVACPHCSTKLGPWRMSAAWQGEPGCATPPTAPQPAFAMRGPVYSWRNRWVAGLLAMFLGIFGVHRFYMGYTGIGILQIVVSICTFGIVTSIWTFVEGILCFCGAMRDADGLPLSG